MSSVETITSRLLSLASEGKHVFGVEVLTIQPGSYDISVSGPGLPSLLISVSERHGSARVIADEYVFECVPHDRVAELAVSLLTGRGTAKIRGFPPFRRVSLAVSHGVETWRVSRPYDGSLYEWETFIRT